LDNSEFNQQSARQAQEDIKQMGRTASAPVRNLAKSGLKKGAKTVGKKVGKAVGKGLKALGKKGLQLAKWIAGKLLAAVKSLIAAIGPWGVLIIIVIVIIVIVFFWLYEDRGATGQLTLDPDAENPLILQEDGSYAPIAMTPAQAYIDAYYKFLAVDSHQKLFVDETGVEHWLSFTDAATTEDFATLTDAFQKESYFYLSSSFIKMADEILHNNEFCFPEQVIKPVFSQVLPLASDPTKKYITALPLVDDGSANAEALCDADDSTVPYAVDSDDVLTPVNGALPKRTVSPLASKALIAKSVPYVQKEVQLRDIEGNNLYVDATGNYYPEGSQPAGAVLAKTNQLSTEQAGTAVPGVWDYGFGSVLQYEPMELNKYMELEKLSFSVHLHYQTKSLEETGDLDANGDPVLRTVYGDPVCFDKVVDVAIGFDTVGDVQDKIAALNEETDDYCITVVLFPGEATLEAVLRSPDNITMKVQAEDKALASRYFENPELHAAFGNTTAPTAGTAPVSKYRYPLKTAVVSAAATFSGNIRYEYRTETITSELVANTITWEDLEGMFGKDDGSITTQIEYGWFENCTQVEYGKTGCGARVSFFRAGTVYEERPTSVPKEITVPTGFQYVEDFCSNYQVYVPNLVQDTSSFLDRVNMPMDGTYDEEKDINNDGEVTVLDMLLKLGLLRQFLGSPSPSEGNDAFSTAALTPDEQAMMRLLGCEPTNEGEVLLLAKVIEAEAGPEKLDQLALASIILNRMKHPSRPNTMIGVISEDGEFPSWSDASTPLCNTPSAEAISSAKQAMYGEFALPSNVIYRVDGLMESSTCFLFCPSTTGTTWYYYAPGYEIVDTDLFGRSVRSSEELSITAEILHQRDITEGLVPGAAGSQAAASSVAADGQFLYKVADFDASVALRNLQNVTSRTSPVGPLDYIVGSFASVSEQVQGFLSLISEFRVGGSNQGDFVFPYGRNIALSDMRDIVIQAASFSDQSAYTEAAQMFDPEALQFIFVGTAAKTGFAGGTKESTASLIPGTASVFEGFISPTALFYTPTVTWTEVTQKVQIPVPSGTVLYAVGESVISSVSENKVTFTTTVAGKSLVLVYEGLEDENVRLDQRVERGYPIGCVGSGGLALSLTLDGVSVDPMEYFYQPENNASCAFVNILNKNGFLDNRLKNDLSALLNEENNVSNETYDKWHDPAYRGEYHTRSVGTSVWWAYGRGWQFCESRGTLPDGGLPLALGRAEDYYKNGAKTFFVGAEPRAGAWVVWMDNDAGHVAFVEAVTATGDIVVSETSEEIWNSGDGTGINIRTITKETNYEYASGYQFVGFIYLDSPLEK